MLDSARNAVKGCKQCRTIVLWRFGLELAEAGQSCLISGTRVMNSAAAAAAVVLQAHGVCTEQ